MATGVLKAESKLLSSTQFSNEKIYPYCSVSGLVFTHTLPEVSEARQELLREFGAYALISHAFALVFGRTSWIYYDLCRRHTSCSPANSTAACHRKRRSHR